MVSEPVHEPVIPVVMGELPFDQSEPFSNDIFNFFLFCTSKEKVEKPEEKIEENEKLEEISIS